MSRVPAIGIDLGTTFSCVGVFQNDRVEIIANDLGHRTTPSYVAFTDQECLIGEVAKRQEVINPFNTVFDVKRLIGRRFEDEVVQGSMKRWPFKVINSKEIPKVEVQHCGKTKHFTAEQISSMVLSKMKEIAEAYLDEKVTSAVITVPAYFNASQRQATIDAGKLAGLNVLRLINEPTAAALAYGVNKRCTSQHNVLVFDWGGGTFDVSIMSIKNGEFEVKAVGGDTHLGGEDITSLLVDHFVETFKRDHDEKDLTTNKTAISRLRKECEEAKWMLSSAENTYITIPSLFEGIDFNTSLTRAKFEHLCSNLLNRTMDAVKTALSDAKMEKADVHEILLVGGSTRIPKVGMMLQDFFEGKEVKRSINADEAVAYGAAILAANLTGQGPAGMQDLVLLEVTPLSLGLHDSWGMMTTVVERNTPIPMKQTKVYRTSNDNQSEAVIWIFEGERARACDNRLLGEFVLADLPPAPRGKIKVDVTFEIDENGILRVSAVERSTGKRNSIKITNYKHRPSENEMEQRSKDEENLKKEDEEERSRVAAMKSLVNYIYSMKKMLEKEDVKRKTSEEYRESILAKFVETMRWLDTNKEATKEDYKQMHKMLESECSLIIKELKSLSL
ncbi:unnamed protein product [Taenia asiatica]|uniref:Heat shock protein 70 n=1 Tax=Taenia asiatica TaxID=60517 RepID=A0A0R3VWU0_TAEAS|nr:unnamed protein product [Taenia asiatica]